MTKEPTYEERLQAFKSLSSAFMPAAAIFAAIELQLFTLLGQRELTDSELASSVGASARSIRVLAEALVGLGYLERRGERFANTSFALRALVATSEFYEGDSALLSLWFMRQMSELAVTVRAGEPVETYAELVTRSEDQAATFVHAMDQVSRGFVDEFVNRVGPIAGPFRFLDVGGAAGSYAMALVDAHPNARAVVLELPNSAMEAQRVIAQRGRTDQVSVVAGDFRTADFGENFDMVFCSNVMHLTDPHLAANIVEKASRALRKNGRFVIKDMIGDEQGSATGLGLYSLLMLAISRGGRLHSMADYTGWCLGAGLTSPVRVDCWERSSLLIAEKR